jgi:protein SCO1
MNRKNVINLQTLLLVVSLLMLPLFGQAQTSDRYADQLPRGAAPDPTKGKIARITDKGLFSVAVVIQGSELVKGANSVRLDIYDKQGRPVSGAEVTAMPWLPSAACGVPAKPVVTKLKDGKYRIDNIVFDRNGFWDLKVFVKSGAQEDRAVFSFSVGVGAVGRQEESGKTGKKYPRSVEYYKVPNVTLLNQDGKKVKLATFVDSGKPVIIDFIYTTCTTICPVLSAGFLGVRSRLGKDANTVQLISLSIDPENDRPEQMKEYLGKFHVTEGWDFLTGSLADMRLVIQEFSACKSDKMNHQPLYLLHAPKSDTWVRIEGLISSSDLLDELKRLESKGI